MIQLSKALNAWGTSEFKAVLKLEIARLGVAELPLQQGLSTSSYASTEPITAMIINVAEMEKIIRVKAGIFYRGVIGGCSCVDDPTPANENNEYCEVHLDIDKGTAATSVVLVA